MYYVGLDLHSKSSCIYIMTSLGKKVRLVNIRGGWDAVLKELRKIRKPFSIAFEASCGYGAFYRELKKITPRITVANPSKMAAIYQSKKKSDETDAQTLAVLLRINRISEVHVPKESVQDWRRMIESRCSLIQKRVKTKNQLKAILRSYGIAYPQKLWTKKKLAWLAEVDLPTVSAMERDRLLQELALFNTQVKEITKVLDGLASTHQGVQLLMSIPGVGPRTAECFMAYLDTPKRFKDSKKVASYFGVIPEMDASAGVKRLGHITRQGPSAVRHMVTEACWLAMRRSPTIKAYFDKQTRGRKDKRKIALVATGHYLIRCMYAMLRDGQPWQETVNA